MKTVFRNVPYCKLYKDILQKTDRITFEQFIILRDLNMIESQRVHFIIPDDSSDDDFGHFEIEKNMPTYNYDIFFNHNYAK